MKNIAICANVCQVTQGAEPKFAPTPYAQWIRVELEKRGWQKQDLAAAIQKKERGRLKKSGALQLVYRATDGKKQTAKSRARIAAVLGPEPAVRVPDHLPEALAQLREAMEAVLRLLPPPARPQAASKRRA